MLRNILVVCVGNICRSPMAEVLLAETLPPGYSVSSAGIAALIGEPADPMAVALVAERGLSLNDHAGRQVDQRLVTESDLICVMETSQADWIERHWPQSRGRLYCLGHWGGFQIPDPYRRGEAAFRESLELIDRGVREWHGKLSKLS